MKSPPNPPSHFFLSKKTMRMFVFGKTEIYDIYGVIKTKLILLLQHQMHNFQLDGIYSYSVWHICAI